MAKAGDKEILRNFIAALAGLTDVTTDMLDKQLQFAVDLAKWSPKFQESQGRLGFWKNVSEDLDSFEVATLFISLSKMGELAQSLQKFGTLKSEEQAAIVKEYKEVRDAFDNLRDKLNE